MRQVESKSGNIKRLSFFLSVLLLILAGCGDNPQDKAAKAVHEQIDQALTHSEGAQAEQQVQSAISAYRPTGLAGDSANLVSGHLMLGRGLSLGAELDLKTAPVRNAVDAIAAQLIYSQQWLLEKERIAKMLALRDSEIADLKSLISGTPALPGLQARLAEAQAEQTKLTDEKQAVQQEKDKIQAVLDDYQARSEALLNKADLAKGDEKLSLKKQAYDLLLERTGDYVKSQAAENQMGVLDGQIALVETRVQSLQDNLQRTQAQVEALETAEARKMLKGQQAEIDTLLSDQQKSIYASADAIKAGLDAYRQAAQEISDILEKAAEQYQKVRSTDAGFTAAVRQADSYTYAAKVCAEQMAFSRNIATRLTGMVASADETLTQGLAERLPLNAELDPERLEKVMGFFDLADKAYEDAFGQARRIVGRGKDAACSILNSHILALRSKMQWADALAQYEPAKQAQDRLEALKIQGQEFGSLFTLSETARLLDKGLDFVPALAVNAELYFESLRPRLGEWKQQTTPELQAAAVEKNLVEMEALVNTYGDEMSRLLEPLKTEMLAAKERGFVAPAGAAATGEPNSL